jgi:hypothetical protein
VLGKGKSGGFKSEPTLPTLEPRSNYREKVKTKMNMKSNIIEANILQHMKVVGRELTRLIQSSGTNAKVFVHSYTNSRIINAHASYFPHGDPAEDTIDISINLTIQSEYGVLFECDICRSTGEILAEIADRVIESDSGEDLLTQIDLLSQESVKEILVHLEETIM